MGALGKGIRVCIFAGDTKIVFECKNKREASKVKCALSRAREIVDEANLAYENGLIDRGEYYCRYQSAIMLAPHFSESLTRQAKYIGNR